MNKAKSIATLIISIAFLSIYYFANYKNSYIEESWFEKTVIFKNYRDIFLIIITYFIINNLVMLIAFLNGKNLIIYTYISLFSIITTFLILLGFGYID